MTQSTILADLASFTGTTRWYADPALPGLSFTDGIHHFVQETRATQVLLVAHQMWLEFGSETSLISLNFRCTQGTPSESGPTEGSAVCEVVDGDYNPLAVMRIPALLLPIGAWEFWIENNVLLLPSEH